MFVCALATAILVRVERIQRVLVQAADQLCIPRSALGLVEANWARYAPQAKAESHATSSLARGIFCSGEPRKQSEAKKTPRPCPHNATRRGSSTQAPSLKPRGAPAVRALSRSGVDIGGSSRCREGRGITTFFQMRIRCETGVSKEGEQGQTDRGSVGERTARVETNP